MATGTLQATAQPALRPSHPSPGHHHRAPGSVVDDRLFVDGWAHNNLDQIETFFTPWHALFYSVHRHCPLDRLAGSTAALRRPDLAGSDSRLWGRWWA